MPDIKIKTDQLKKTSKVCPISGWAANNKPITKVIKKEIKYLKYILVYFSLLKIKLIRIIKNGLTNSIGWNLGNILKSSHLRALFTSIPIIGTKNKKTKEIMKITGEILKSFSSFIEDSIKIITNPKKTKERCLKKKA